MTTQAPQAYDWLKQLPPSLMSMDGKPLFGKGPAFPWDAFSKELGAAFDVKNLTISPVSEQWRGADTLLAGYEKSPLCLCWTMSALEGEAYWIMSHADIDSFIHELLGKPSTVFTGLDPDFAEGFYHFFAALAAHAFGKVDFDKALTPVFSPCQEPPRKEAFCLDISCSLGSKKFQGRLILSPELLNAWRERFSDRKLDIDIHSPLAQKLQVTVHLEAGKTTLTQEELSRISPGDFVILDQCSYEPDDNKGRLMMTMEGVPMFRAKLKQGSLKILEFPLYHEVEAPMSKDETDEESIGDFDDESEAEDLSSDEDLSEFEESEMEESQVEEESSAETETGTEDEHETEEEHEEEFSEESSVTEKAPPKKEKAGLAPKPVAAGPKKPINPAEMPVNVIVEVGRLQMSIQELMGLQPGNMLELNIHPEDGVDLVVNGRRIAKGELLKVGEALGVRILDIG